MLSLAALVRSVMTADQTSAWLAPEDIESFWRWTRDLEAITWWGGDTIAFHQEIESCLRHLQPFGFPRFEEVILVLAACRESWMQPGGGKRRLLNFFQSFDSDPLPPDNQDVIANWVTPLLNGLDGVHESYMENPSLSRKHTILEVLFASDGHDLSADKAQCVVDGLSRSTNGMHECLRDALPVGSFDSSGHLIITAPKAGNLRTVQGNSYKAVTPKCTLGVVDSPGKRTLTTAVAARVSGEIVTHRFPTLSRAVSEGEGLATIRLSRTPKVSFIQTIRNLLDVLPLLEAAGSLEAFEQTGLGTPPPAPPDPAEDLPDCVVARNLIDALAHSDREADRELAGIARIARDLLGMLPVPRDIGEPEEMPLGGFSDIANKGDLDRLLLTELAQDDEALAIRVALNEALYLRRETPPKTPARQRHIFIDNGIRMWGTPRALSHSVALALTAGMDRRDSSSTWSSNFSPNDFDTRSTLIEADLSTADGLHVALSHLAPSAVATRQAEDFLEQAKFLPHCDRFVITDPRSINDPKFKRLLHRSPGDHPVFSLSVDIDGEIVLSAHTHSGTRELRRIKVDLDQLGENLRRSPAASATRRAHTDPELPAILGIDPFPLRLAHPPQTNSTWFAPDGEIVTLSSKGLLLYYDRRNRGALQLSDSVATPCGVLTAHFETSAHSEGYRLLMASGRNAEPRITVIDLDSSHIETCTIELGSSARHALYVDGCIIFFEEELASCYSPGMGKILFQEKLVRPPITTQGRFVKLGDEWFAVSITNRIHLTKISVRQKRHIATVFDCPSYPEPLVLMEDGIVYRYDGEKMPAISFTNHPLRVGDYLSVTENGNRLAFLRQDATRNYCIYQFDSEPHSKEDRGQHNLLDPRFRRLESSVPTLRKNFQAAGLNGDTLTVVNPGRLQLGIFSHDAQNIGLYEVSPETDEVYNFEPIESPAPGFSLKKAEFPDGSAVFLDSRGLLHLKSASPSIAEITFVVKDRGPLSGWTSNGEFFGHDYFIGDHEKSSADEILTHVREFARHIRDSKDACDRTNLPAKIIQEL